MLAVFDILLSPSNETGNAVDFLAGDVLRRVLAGGPRVGVELVVSYHGEKSEGKRRNVHFVELPLTVPKNAGLEIVESEAVVLDLLHLDWSTEVLSEIAVAVFHKDELEVDIVILELGEGLEGELEFAAVIEFDVLV